MRYKDRFDIENMISELSHQHGPVEIYVMTLPGKSMGTYRIRCGGKEVMSKELSEGLDRISQDLEPLAPKGDKGYGSSGFMLKTTETKRQRENLQRIISHMEDYIQEMHSD